MRENRTVRRVCQDLRPLVEGGRGEGVLSLYRIITAATSWRMRAPCVSRGMARGIPHAASYVA